jgi:DNA-directed RNA polymerase subunit H (RpoH/RPB5)
MPSHNTASGYHEQREHGWDRNSHVYHKQHGWVTEDKFKELEDNAVGAGFFDGLNDFFEPAREFIQDRVEDISEIPLVQQTVGAVTPAVQFIGGGVRYSPGPIKDFLDNLEGTKELVSDNLRASGIDPRVGDVGFALAEEAALAGGGKFLKGLSKLPTLGPPRTPQLVASSGGLHLQFAPDVSPDLSQQVFDITIKNPEFIAPGVREGIAKDPDVARQIVDRSNKVEKQANRLETWRQAELKAKTPKEKAVAKKNQKKATADLKSQMSNVPQIVQDDPIAYRVAQFKDVDKIEQHHLISKAQTAGYYDQMDYLIERDLADHDDLVAMGEYAKMRGAASGDRLSNMLNMNKIPHNEYHTYLRDTGQEIKPEKIREIVRKAKNADELMELYKDFIDNQISVKQDAIAYQNLWDMDK